jgi:hypothetical protein
MIENTTMRRLSQGFPINNQESSISNWQLTGL